MLEGLVEDGGFHVLDAAQAPLAGGHLMDAVEFGESSGAPRFDVALEEGVVFFLALVGEDDGSTGESVTGGVLGGAGLAFRGHGAAGQGSVLAGC